MSVEAICAILSVILSVITTAVSIFIILGKRLQQIQDLIVDRDGMKKELKDIDKKIAAFEEFKTNTQKFIDSKIYQANSPLSLTEFGRKLIKESGFEEIFDREKDKLVEKLELKTPTTKYDAQEKAREVMNDLTECPEFQPLKEYAFKTGSDYAQILRAGAIPLRDYYLEKHPEITS